MPLSELQEDMDLEGHHSTQYGMQEEEVGETPLHGAHRKVCVQV